MLTRGIQTECPYVRLDQLVKEALPPLCAAVFPAGFQRVNERCQPGSQQIRQQRLQIRSLQFTSSLQLRAPTSSAQARMPLTVPNCAHQWRRGLEADREERKSHFCELGRPERLLAAQRGQPACI